MIEIPVTLNWMQQVCHAFVEEKKYSDEMLEQVERLQNKYQNSPRVYHDGKQ